MRVERRDESVRREYESTGEPGGTFLRDVRPKTEKLRRKAWHEPYESRGSRTDL